MTEEGPEVWHVMTSTAPRGYSVERPLLVDWLKGLSDEQDYLLGQVGRLAPLIQALAGAMTAPDMLKMDGKNIQDLSIEAKKIGDLEITAKKIVDLSITGDKIANLTIEATKIVDGTIEAKKIKDLEITGQKIADLTIEGKKIVDLTIESKNIKDATIEGRKIVELTIEGKHIKDATIEGKKIKDLSIDATKIVDLSIDATKIQNLTISADKIVNLTITAAKIASYAIETSKLKDGAVTNSKVASLSVDKLTAGTIQAGQYIKCGTGDVTIDPDGITLGAQTGDTEALRWALSAKIRGTIYGKATGSADEKIVLRTKNAAGTVTTSVVLKDGGLGVGTEPTAALDLNSNILRLRDAKTPASAGASGNKGDICWNASYIFVCVGTNSWKRAELSAW